MALRRSLVSAYWDNVTGRLVSLFCHEIPGFVPQQLPVLAAPIPISGTLSLTATTNGATYEAANGTVVQVDALALPTSYSASILLPAGGAITVVSVNGALLDGVTTTQTRTYSSTNKVVTIISRGTQGSFVVAP